MTILETIADLINQGDVENSLTLIIEHQDDYIEDAIYWNLRGLLCLIVEEFDSAVSCFETALGIEPCNPDVYYNYGFALEKIGDKSDAALFYGMAYRNANDESLKVELSEMFKDNLALRRIFEEAASGAVKHFILLSSCAWGDIYQRMHHIARSLKRLGHDVSYVTPATQIKLDVDEASVLDLTNASLQGVRTVEGVKIYTPMQVSGIRGTVLDNYTHLVQRILDDSPKRNRVVMITYMPYQVNTISALRGDFFHIYDCVDDHSDLEYAFWGTKSDIIWEQHLMDTADAITTTATSLFLQRTAIEKRKNVHLVRNGVNGGDFSTIPKDVPEDLKGIPGPRIVYVGAIYDWFDKELFYDVVTSNPDKSFVVIGFGNEKILDRKADNLYLLGAKKHSELQNYLRHCQIGIVPFRDDTDLIVNCDPIKLYEYIACGVPVITTFMPEAAIDKSYTFLANTKDSFNDAIFSCLNEKMDQELIDHFVVENSWNVKAATMCMIADRKVGPDEQMREFEHVDRTLGFLSEEYNSPIFKMLRAVCFSVDNPQKFVDLAREAYESKSQKYIERMYLTSLMITAKYSEFVDIVSKSPFIREELKLELLHCSQLNDPKRIRIVSFLCISNMKEAMQLIEEVSIDRDYYYLYSVYVGYLLGGQIGPGEIKLIGKGGGNSPVFEYLVSNVHSVVGVYVADVFDDTPEGFLKSISASGLSIVGLCSPKSGDKMGIGRVSVSDVVHKQVQSEARVIVPYNNQYIQQVRALAESGVISCEIAVQVDSKLVMVNIDPDLMQRIKKREYNRTVTFNKFNAADSNVHALLRYMPHQYKEKYAVNVIHGKEVWTIDNIVKVPLISAVTVSGFATFLYYYPKFTYNIEVGHAGVSLKALGNMHRKDRNWGGNSEIFQKADLICVDSHLDMITMSSFFGLTEDRFAITGLPRYNLLTEQGSREKLEGLLGISLDNKKVIFNMPTFRVIDWETDGSCLDEKNDSFKIAEFDYRRFNQFLDAHSVVCISKVHHGEEASIRSKSKGRAYSSLFFIDNEDLDNRGLNLYEILAAGDVLITDYSTVYNDFLYQNKPVIFLNTDIEEYRRETGLALEPYEFWTAGPKVSSQAQLEDEIVKCLHKEDYYREERERLQPVFFKYNDHNATSRIWELIDKRFSAITNSLVNKPV